MRQKKYFQTMKCYYERLRKFTKKYEGLRFFTIIYDTKMRGFERPRIMEKGGN